MNPQQISEAQRLAALLEVDHHEPLVERAAAELLRALAAQAAQAQQPVPAQAVAPFLFIAMDDDKRAHLTWCADESEVRAAVAVAMFWLADGEHMSAEHAEELDANVAELLDCGALTFEGDPPLYLYRVRP